MFSVSDDDQGGVLQKWSLQTRQAAVLAELPATPVQLTLTADGDRICLALEQSATVLAADTGDTVCEWSFPGVRVVRLRPMAEQDLFVACTRDGRVHVLASGRPEPIFTMKVEGQNVFDALSAGRRLLTCSQKGGQATSVWNVSIRSPVVYPVLAQQLPQKGRASRQWTDASGLFQIDAAVREVTAGEVLLQPAEGGEPLRITRSQLSRDDQGLLADWVANAEQKLDGGDPDANPLPGQDPNAPANVSDPTTAGAHAALDAEAADESGLQYWPLGADYEMAPLSLSASRTPPILGEQNRWRLMDAAATSDGWVWLATSQGLFMIRRHQATVVRGPRFPEESVLAVCPHPAGGVAVSLAARGVVRVEPDPQAEVQGLGFPAPDPAEAANSMAPTLLALDGAQRLWAAGGFPGAAWLAADGWRLQQPKAGALQPKALWLQPHEDGVLAWLEGGAGLYEGDARGLVRVKWPYPGGVICMGLHGDGQLAAFTIQDQTNTGFALMKSKRFVAVGQQQLNPSVRVLAAAPDARGGIWVGSDQGLGRWKNNRFEFWNEPFRGEAIDWMRPLLADSILVGGSATGRYYVVRPKQP